MIYFTGFFFKTVTDSGNVEPHHCRYDAPLFFWSAVTFLLFYHGVPCSKLLASLQKVCTFYTFLMVFFTNTLYCVFTTWNMNGKIHFDVYSFWFFAPMRLVYLFSCTFRACRPNTPIFSSSSTFYSSI